MDIAAVSLLQAIHIRTSPGHVETAVMHIIDMDFAAADDRLLAMHHRSPIHTYMFDSKGVLLQANNAALSALRKSSGIEQGFVISQRFSTANIGPSLMRSNDV